jgi:hypothetical protein
MSEKRKIDLKKEYKNPIRFFENCGLVIPEHSFLVHLENVINDRKQDIKTIVDSGKYFSIFAPRQSGKTTFLTEETNQFFTEEAVKRIQAKSVF